MVASGWGEIQKEKEKMEASTGGSLLAAAARGGALEWATVRNAQPQGHSTLLLSCNPLCSFALHCTMMLRTALC